MEQAERAILRTIIYSDVFDAPLAKEELWRLLLTKRKLSYDTFEQALENISGRQRNNQSKKVYPIILQNAFYCLHGREELIRKKIKNLPEGKRKMRIAAYAASFLSYIPTIKLIGVSGSLAAENVSRSDDIDLFIITRADTVFITRLFALGLLELMGLRRKRNDENHADTICLNLLIDEKAILWPIEKQDVYTAHEIVRLKPLFERDNMCYKFFNVNIWVKKFIVNGSMPVVTMPGRKWFRRYYLLQLFISFILLFSAERISRLVQKYFMLKHQTSEVITKHFLAFHPNDYRSRSLDSFNSKIKQYRLLTNP